METRIDFLHWLSKKLYLSSIGLYATIVIIMLLPMLFTHSFGLHAILANFIAVFIVAFIRATYESLLIYEAPIKSLSLPKMSFLSLVTALSMSLISYFIKPSMSYFSIPVAIIASLVVVNRLKNILWPAHERPGFLAELPAKLTLAQAGRYRFFALLVGITWFACAQYNVHFGIAFTIAFFIGMMCEEWYTITSIYNQSLTAKQTITLCAWSAACAIAATAIVVVLMKQSGYSGQAATIASVIVIKLIQPWGSRTFML